MPREVTGLRVARSFVTPAAGSTVTRELDFQLAPTGGIAIYSVLGYGHLDINPTGNTFTVDSAQQTLHLETGTVETPPISPADDEDDIDTEIFYAQFYSALYQDEAATRGGSAVSLSITPNGLVTFPEPIHSARNISHRGINVSAEGLLNVGVLIYYKYVMFSLAEMGALLARRQ